MAKKIKVAFLDYSPHYAGAERAMATILSRIDRTKYDVCLIAPMPRLHHIRYGELEVPLVYLNQNTKWWMGRWRWKKPWRGMDFLMRSILGLQLLFFVKRHSIDILHVNLLRPDSFMWLLPCHIAGVKVVGHFRSLPETWIPASRVQKCCDAIICVSRVVWDHLRQKYKHRRTYIVYDPVEVKKVDTGSRETMKTLLGLDPRRTLIASVAALFPNKGHDNAIRAFAAIADEYPMTDLYIAGGGNMEELQRLKDIAKSYQNVKGRIFFSGAQLDDVSVAYKAATLVLSLTKEGEAFGLVPLEAALFSTPSLAPCRGAITEFTQPDHSSFLVDTNSVEAIAQRIREILNSPKKADEVCDQLKKIVSEKFAPCLHVRQIEDIYQAILEH